MSKPSPELFRRHKLNPILTAAGTLAWRSLSKAAGITTGRTSPNGAGTIAGNNAGDWKRVSDYYYRSVRVDNGKCLDVTEQGKHQHPTLGLCQPGKPAVAAQ